MVAGHIRLIGPARTGQTRCPLVREPLATAQNDRRLRFQRQQRNEPAQKPRQTPAQAFASLQRTSRSPHTILQLQHNLPPQVRFPYNQAVVPSAGIEPAPSPPEGDALSPELRGREDHDASANHRPMRNRLSRPLRSTRSPTWFPSVPNPAEIARLTDEKCGVGDRHPGTRAPSGSGCRRGGEWRNSATKEGKRRRKSSTLAEILQRPPANRPIPAENRRPLPGQAEEIGSSGSAKAHVGGLSVP